MCILHIQVNRPVDTSSQHTEIDTQIPLVRRFPSQQTVRHRIRGISDRWSSTIVKRITNQRQRTFRLVRIYGRITSLTKTKINNGIFKDEDYERYSIRLNLNHEINKYVKIGAQTQYSHAIQQRGAGLASGWRLSPLAQLWDENGEIIPLPGSYNVYNTMMDLVPGAVDRPVKTTRYLGSYSLDIKLPVDGLKFRSNLGLDARTVQDYEFWSAKTSNRGMGTSYAKNAVDKYTMFTLENMLFYDKTFNDKHTLGVTLLQSIQEDKRESVNVAMENLPADNLKYYDLGSGLVTNTIGSSMIKWNMASFMGRINYNYLGRYLLTVSARYDGSSRLADGHKWVLFPSAALAWRINEESFMSSTSGWLDLSLIHI